jgi:SAM-dependent methyltransferase
MGTDELKTFMATYEWAKTWRDLPWAHDEATLFLAELCAKRKPGRALDIGCGAGTDSVYLAQRGWEVTALDFIPRALEFTAARAREAGVTVTPVQADITTWQSEQPYDLVLDHGLLHNLDPVRHPAYRQTVLQLLAGEGDLILLHWHPRFPGQVNGKMGPRRVSREDIQAFFAPELQERFFAREEFEDLPELVGGGMTQAYYWFQRNQAQRQAAVLIEQIEATLRRHKIDAAGLIAAAGSRPVAARLVSLDLPSRLIGPGRLGISHQVLAPVAAEQRLREWAAQSGLDAHHVQQLFNLFMSADHGDICGTTPKCTQCEVRFCKRLRYR